MDNIKDEKFDHVFNEKLLSWLDDDYSAYEMCQGLLYVAHLWDDLIDKDKPRTDKEINDAFIFILGKLPLNSFYLNNCTNIAPLITSCVIQYPVNNELEKGNNGEKLMAFCLRNSLLTVIAFCIELKGNSAIEFYRYLSRGFDGYLSEFMGENHA